MYPSFGDEPTKRSNKTPPLQNFGVPHFEAPSFNRMDDQLQDFDDPSKNYKNHKIQNFDVKLTFFYGLMIVTILFAIFAFCLAIAALVSSGENVQSNRSCEGLCTNGKNGMNGANGNNGVNGKDALVNVTINNNANGTTNVTEIVYNTSEFDVYINVSENGTFINTPGPAGPKGAAGTNASVTLSIFNSFGNANVTETITNVSNFGVNINITGSINGSITGPTTSTNGSVAIFNGSTGTSIMDSGILYTNLVTALSNSVVGNVAMFSNSKSLQDSGFSASSVATLSGTTVPGNIPLFTTGRGGYQMSDSGVSAAKIVTDFSSSTDGDVVIYNGTSGKIIKDSGILYTNLVTALSTSTTGNMTMFSNTKSVQDAGFSASSVAVLSGTTISGNVPMFTTGKGGYEMVDSGVSASSLLKVTGGSEIYSGLSGYIQNTTTTWVNISVVGRADEFIKTPSTLWGNPSPGIIEYLGNSSIVALIVASGTYISSITPAHWNLMQNSVIINSARTTSTDAALYIERMVTLNTNDIVYLQILGDGSDLSAFIYTIRANII